MRGLSGKRVIVTGGGSGIGRKVGERFGEEGAEVFIFDLNGEGARATAEKILSAGGEAEAFQVDISTIERHFLNTVEDEQPSELLALIMALFCIGGLKNRLWFGMENLFPRTEVMHNEFGGITASSRVLFYPLRFFQAFKLALRIISTAVKNRMKHRNNKLV